VADPVKARAQHKDLKPQMHIMTPGGWREVKEAAAPWLGGTYLVRLTDGTSEIQEPDFLWLLRVNTLNAKGNRH
jgi:hypothetical protein